MMNNKLYIKLAIVCLLMLAMCAPVLSPICYAVKRDGSPIMVSMGDSYSSGEGVEPFYGQYESLEKKIFNKDWLAHRSEHSWPGKLSLPSLSGTMSDHKGENWFFVASSGATTNDLYNEQKIGYHRFGFTETNEPVLFDDAFLEKAEMGKQLDALDALGESVDYVTLTLGGNDADFVGIITESFWNVGLINVNKLTDKFNKVWKEFFYGVNGNQPIRDRLYDAYGAIRTRVGEQAQILVAGYPKLIDPAGGLFIHDNEAAMINDNVTKFNRAIHSVVNSCNGAGTNIHFISVEEAFETHGAYSEDPYINEVIIPTQAEDLDETAFPPVSAYSIHPNNKGTQAYAKCVQAKIDELEGKGVYANDVQLHNDFQLSVYNSDDQLYDNYSVEIDGIELDNVFGFFGSELNSKRYSDTLIVDSAESTWINLPNGNYSVTIKDLADTSATYSKNIQVRSDNARNNLVFTTNIDSTGDNQSISVEGVSQQRNIVLTLDVSGSMAGTPLDETKKASIKFIETVLKEDASTGIVTYDDESVIASGFSKSRATLERIVTELQDGGATNIEAGLRDAQWMLDKNNAKKDFIVLMSDGEPNSGKVGDELIAYANEIKEAGTKIYTLGFFESLGDKSEAQYLMEQIASKGCHYEVASAEDLVFFFEDMADQINGQKYIYVRIACPVDVKVSHDGETLCSSENDLNTRTSFGTLTFEDSQSGSDEETTTEEADIITEDSVKVLRLKTGVDYDLEINGTGTGHMDYTIGFMDDDGEYSDMRHINNVKITRDTVINTVATEADENIMDVDEDGDGQTDYSYRVGKNGQGELVEPETVSNNKIVVIVIVALIILLLLLLLALLKRPKK